MNRLRVIILFFALLVIGCSGEVKYEVPHNYEGNLIIVLEQKGEPRVKRSHFIFPKNGIIRTSSKMPSAGFTSCYSVNDEGEIYDIGFIPPRSNFDSFGSDGNLYHYDFLIGGKGYSMIDGKKVLVDHPYLAFSVGKAKNRNAILEQRKDFIKKARFGLE